MDNDEWKRADVVRIVLVGDTHGQHRTLHVPSGDFLLHAGDFTLLNRSREEVRDFNQCLSDLPHRRKVVVPGNHDFKFADPKWRNLISGAILLLNEGVELDGIRIWGSPLTPSNFESFGATSEADCARIFSQIPDGTDLVITHGPPFGILDVAERGNGNHGCAHLLAAIRRVRPALHVFGHIHQSYGMASANGTVFVNAAPAGPGYRVIRQPIVIEYDRLTRSVRRIEEPRSHSDPVGTKHNGPAKTRPNFHEGTVE
jgi:Icc-related predicted phosphoesterase